MPRQPAQIRDAVPSDAESLLALWAATLRRDDATPQAVDDARTSLANLAADPDERLLVAESDGEIVAAVQLTRRPVSPLTLDDAVHTSFLLVRPEHRKHGYAHALLEAAVTWAEEKDVHQVTAVTDTNRDTNRFLARLGLGTMATIRVAGTPSLRKKLSTERGRPAAANRHLVEVLAQRRSLRHRQSRS